MKFGKYTITQMAYTLEQKKKWFGMPDVCVEWENNKYIMPWSELEEIKKQADPIVSRLSNFGAIMGVIDCLISPEERIEKLLDKKIEAALQETK